ncbi:MAG: sugar-binding domain-containing protein [Bacteroidota bacterium]
MKIVTSSFQKYLLQFILLTFFLGSYRSGYAQNENPRNTGLPQAQNAKALPSSRVAIPSSERVPKVIERTNLKAIVSNEYILTDGWEMIAANDLQQQGAQVSQTLSTENWYNATVPGTVLTTLVDQGVYPDPFFGVNNLAIPEDLCRQDWWYRAEFDRPENTAKKKVHLLFNGINYEANIWLNGKLLGNIKGAFIRGEFDVTEHLLDKNILAVHVIPPPNPGIPHEASAIDPKGPNGGALCQDGPTFICSEGWDWMPGIRDRNIGIWQDVRLKIHGGSYFQNPQIITDLPLPDTTKASLSLKTDLIVEKKGNYNLTLKVAGKSISKKLKLKEGTNAIILSSNDIVELNIDKPKLWWPNGYGAQNLYHAELILKKGNEVLDEQKIRFGIRELDFEFAVSTKAQAFKRITFNPTQIFQKYNTALFDNMNRVKSPQGVELPTLYDDVDVHDLEEIKNDDNPYLVVKVNGQRIFCKGGNWGMDDAMKRVSRERMEPYFRLHKDANYTMIRNWTGESTEEVFYELADEYGLLVWNDFWMSTQFYNMPPKDEELFMRNAEDVVKRFINHPSIVIWCARNEGYAPHSLEKRLADLIAQRDGTRMYLSNSRHLNLRFSGPWHYQNPHEYFGYLADGFTTEVGTISFATAETTKAMMSAEDVWPISDVWYYHDLHTRQEYFRAATINNFGESFNAEDFLARAQVTNYDSHRAIFEAWNNKLWEDASGVLLWMTHPAWPSMIWQTYTYDYETHGAYFGAKKACEPVHIQMNSHDQQVVAINTSLKSYPEVIINATTLDVNGNVIHQKDTSLALSSNEKVDCFHFGQKNKDFDVLYYFTKLKLSTPSGQLLSENLYLHSTRWDQQFEQLSLLKNIALKTTQDLSSEDGKVVGKIMLENTDDTLALFIKMNARDRISKERVLPAYFSDGYFCIFPNEQKEISIEFDSADGKSLSDYVITFEGHNVEDQIIELGKTK